MVEAAERKAARPAILPQTCAVCGTATARTVMTWQTRRLISCASCGVSVVEPRPTLEQLQDHFARITLSAEEVQRRFERNRGPILQQVAKSVSAALSGGRVLDLGCASGVFLSDHLTGHQWHRLGIDVSPTAVSNARANGIEAQVGTIRDVSISAHSIDLVTALDVFYYFPDPKIELAQVRNLLSPFGLLAIEVPDGRLRLWRLTTCVASFLFPARTSPDDGDHVWFYTPKALKLLLEANGFVVLSVSPLAANRPESRWHQLIYKIVSVLGMAIWHATRGRVAFSPRFVVLARVAGPR